MENQKKGFRSRISALVIGFLLALLILCIVPIMRISALYFMGGIVLLAVFTRFSYRYTVSGNRLYVSYMNVKISVDIADIVSVKRIYTPIPSPAASLKKLRIHFKKGAEYFNWFTWATAPNLLISPVREEEFIEALKAVNPSIEVNVPEKTGRWWRIWDWDI